MQRYQPVQMDINPDVLSEANNHRDFIEEILGQYENIDNRHDFLGRITENDLSFYKDSFAQNVMNKLRDEMSQRILFQEITHSDEDLWKDFLNGMDHVSDEDLKHEFLRFFFVQYFRSPVRIDAQKRSFEDFKDLYPNESKKFNTDFYVKYQMIFLAEQVALNLSSYFHTWIERIENQTEISFITSDTPAINLTGTDLLDKNEFYYPISPYVAIKLCITSANNPSYGQHDNENIVIKNPEDVQFLNRVIFSQCKNEVFANHRSILEKIASNAD